jgi:UDP-galactopyranose mutase
MKRKFLIVGAGFSGAVLANRLADLFPDSHIEIWEERAHIAGNCYTNRDTETGVMVHQYGPHIFNTDKKHIWDFVNQYVQLVPFRHRVLASSQNRIYSLPVNLQTINKFFNAEFCPAQAQKFIESKAIKLDDEPQNFEEQALKFIGRELYEAFFYGYTKKQWGCDPRQLPASILKRLPVRFCDDDSYYSNPYVGIPKEGYTVFVEKLLQKGNIHLVLNKKFVKQDALPEFDHTFFTGPLDSFFNHKHGRLGYRTVTFEPFVHTGTFQEVAVVNYCDESVGFTRIAEHKHFTPWEYHEKTICFKEYSKETTEDDVPFYPKRLCHDKTLLKKYRREADSLTGVSFLGRLGTYRYMDMHHVIGESIEFAQKFSCALKTGLKPPVFPNEEAF